MSFERFLKSLHAWLGVLILPWVVVIGLTGFYLNHWKSVDAILAKPSYDEGLFDMSPKAGPQTLEDARALARRLWPSEPLRRAESTVYHQRTAWQVKTGGHLLIVDDSTGHYWVKTRWKRKTYSPNGTLLHSKTYWGALFKTLHERGWFNATLGTWLADITALALVVFGVSGLYMFFAPRMRRRKNRRARLGG